MQESDRAKIRDVKSKVLQMLDERRELESKGASSATPSAYWSGFCSKFEYLLGLSEEYYAGIRLHAFHLDGDNYQVYHFGDRDRWRQTYDLDRQTRGLPQEFVINEPEGGIGHRYDNGRFVNSNILRFQRVVSSLYRHGVFAQLDANKNTRPLALEIGAGYGGLSHHMSRLLKRSVYFVVDLPETLLFSASYLQLENPDKKFYVYDRLTFPRLIATGDYLNYDFVALPNYALHMLAALQFDLVINVASLQEMKSAQAEQYIAFISEHCRGTFYSWNEDRQPLNLEMTSVTDLLRKRFDLEDVTEENILIDVPPPDHARPEHIKAIKRIARSFGLLPKRPAVKTFPAFTLPTYREYLCRARPAPGRG